MLLCKRFISVAFFCLVLPCVTYSQSSNSDDEYAGLQISKGESASVVAHRLVGRGGNEWKEKYVVIKRPLADGSFRIIPKALADKVLPGDWVFARKSVMKNQYSLEVKDQSLNQVCVQRKLDKSECSRIARRNGIRNSDSIISNSVLYHSKTWDSQIESDKSLNSNPSDTTSSDKGSEDLEVIAEEVPQGTSNETLDSAEKNNVSSVQERASQDSSVVYFQAINIGLAVILIAIIIIILKRKNISIKSWNPRNFKRLKEFKKEVVENLYSVSNFDANDCIKVDRWRMRLQIVAPPVEFEKIVSNLRYVIPAFRSIGPRVIVDRDYSGFNEPVLIGYISCNRLSAWNPKKMTAAKLTTLELDVHNTLQQSLRRQLVPLAVSDPNKPFNATEEEIQNFVATSHIDCSLDKNKVVVTLNFSFGKQLAPGEEITFGERLATNTEYGCLTLKEVKRADDGQKIRYHLRHLENTNTEALVV